MSFFNSTTTQREEDQVYERKKEVETQHTHTHTHSIALERASEGSFSTVGCNVNASWRPSPTKATDEDDTEPIGFL